MKSIQKNIIEFIEKESTSDEDYQNLILFFNNQQITQNIDEFSETLHLLIQISRNHHRTHDFFEKIERIIIFFRERICEVFTNYELFNFFSRSKRLLLFLIEEKIITVNQTIASIISHDKYEKYFYHRYFYPEMSLFLDEQFKTINQENNYSLDEFKKLRKSGENESYICQLIQKDSCIEFISYVNKNNISVSTTIIEPSIFETNSLLMKNKPTLIEYAAFYGSIQIFKYLFLQKVELTPSLWIYAIHCKNSDIIHFLEENQVKPPEDSFKKCLIESLKCHHKDLSVYIKNNLIQNSLQKDDENFVFLKCLQYYNYKFFSHNFDVIDINIDTFYYLCKSSYTKLVELFLNSKELNINSNYSKKILNHFIFYKNGKNSLHVAVKKGNKRIVEILLSNECIEVNKKFVLLLI